MPKIICFYQATPTLPKCNSNSLSRCRDCNSRGTQHRTLPSLQLRHTHTPATGDPSQENPANFPKNLLSADNLSQLNILSVFSVPPGAAEAVWVCEEICATFHNQGRPSQAIPHLEPSCALPV